MMGILENMAETLRIKRKLSGQSIEKWAEDLEIAQSTLQGYLNGDGNPTLSMVAHLADKLGLDPLALLSGDIEPEQRQTVLLMLETIQTVSVLPQPKRQRFVEQFVELIQLLAEEESV